MKNKIPSEGLRLGRDSGSILCDTLKKVAFSDSLWGAEFYVKSLQSFKAHGDVRQVEPQDRVQCVTSQLRYIDHRRRSQPDCG